MNCTELNVIEALNLLCPNCFLSPLPDSSRVTRSASCSAIDRKRPSSSLAVSPGSVSRLASNISERNSSCRWQVESESWRDSSLKVNIESSSGLLDDECSSNSVRMLNKGSKSSVPPQQQGTLAPITDGAAFHAMHTRRLRQTSRDTHPPTQNDRCVARSVVELRPALLGRVCVLNERGGQLGDNMEACEQTRVRIKCLQWLDSLDSDDADPNAAN